MIPVNTVVAVWRAPCAWGRLMVQLVTAIIFLETPQILYAQLKKFFESV